VVGALAARGAAEYLVLTSGLACWWERFFLLFGLLRFGWVANFISIPVMRGFIQGLMWMTIIGQVQRCWRSRQVTGISLPRSRPSCNRGSK